MIVAYSAEFKLRGLSESKFERKWKKQTSASSQGQPVSYLQPQECVNLIAYKYKQNKTNSA
jgi:hypothetical protein